jgi:hypothetical protein
VRKTEQKKQALGAVEARRAMVANEFMSVDLGDKRRDRRLQRIAGAVAAAPAKPFPRVLANEADVGGFYRFVRNEAVTFDGLLEPHVAASVDRMAGEREVLAVHDSTEFRFGGSRDGLGVVNRSGHGFYGHFTLAVSADAGRTPLGMLAVEPWARTGPTAYQLRRAGKVTQAESQAIPNEGDRWLRCVLAAESAVAGTTSLIHVMDSEADDYHLMGKLEGGAFRWIIRLAYDRVLADVEPGEPRKVRELVARRKVRCKRNVRLSRRSGRLGGKRHRPRTERTATLAITATSVVLRRPKDCPEGPSSLAVNVVVVREQNPPPGQAPIEWLLLTGEPIETDAQILKIVDHYRARWRIEEYFKALKTGCAFEKRQLESWHTLLNALGVLIPIAWSLLNLRSLAREEGDAPARIVLTELQEKVLRAASPTPLPKKLTSRDAMLAVARLGGHLRSNGEPGWQILGSGYQDLLLMAAGYRLAKEEK